MATRVIPALPDCPGSPTEALRFFRNRMGAALAAAQDAFAAARTQLDATNAAFVPIQESVDTLLSSNPDPTTPSSLSELTESLSGLAPGATREQLEQRLAQALDLNVVNGVLYPKGPTDLNGLRSLAQTVGISTSNCDLGLLADQGEGFLLVTSRTETVERGVGLTCGRDIIEYDVIETPIGINVNINRAAEAAGVDASDVVVRLFWLDRVRTDPAALRRLRALGLTAEELGAALLGQNAGRMTSQTVDTSVLGELRKKLTDPEICSLLTRPDTGGITPNASGPLMLRTVTQALNQNTGSNRYTDEDEDGDNAVLLLVSLIDWFRTFDIRVPETSVSVVLQMAIAEAGVELDIEDPEASQETGIGQGAAAGAAAAADIDVQDFSDDLQSTGADGPTIAGVNECDTIFNMVTEAIRTLDLLLRDAQDFFRNLYSALGLGSNQINAGLGLTTCLASFNLGLGANIELNLGLPFLFDTFLTSFAALLATVVAAMIAFKNVICQPQAVIQLLYGGVCGFKPFDFSGCPPALGEIVERLQNILNVILSLIGKVTSATRTLEHDFQYSKALAVNLKNFNPCVLGATAIALALGLEFDEVPVTVTPTVTSTQEAITLT